MLLRKVCQRVCLGRIRSIFGPRDLSPFQGEPRFWDVPRVETLG